MTAEVSDSAHPLNNTERAKLNGEFQEYDVNHAGLDSLNVAAASAVALWELRVR